MSRQDDGDPGMCPPGGRMEGQGLRWRWTRVNRFRIDRLIHSLVTSLIKRRFCVLMTILLIQPPSGLAKSSVGHFSDKVQNFLTNFGYLPESNSEAGNLRTEKQLIDAIKSMQKFGNIPVTGKIDEKTIELMSKRRCGLPDLESRDFSGQRAKRYAPHGKRWPKTDLTWSLVNRSYSLDPGRVRAELSRALSVWSDHSKLTFTEVHPTSETDIVVGFHKGDHNDKYPFDGRGQILAHAFFPGGGRGGDAHFDDDEYWLLIGDKESDEGTSLFAVAAHEFGHSLGLGHSSEESALMYPYYQGITPTDFELPEDDRIGIQTLYGSKEDRVWARIPPTTARPTTTTTTTERVEHRPPPRPIWPDRDRNEPDATQRPSYRYPHYPERRPHPKNPEWNPRYPEQPTETTRRPDVRYYPDRRDDRYWYPPRKPESLPPPTVRTTTTTTTTTPKSYRPDRRPYENPTKRTHVLYPDRKHYHYPNHRDRHQPHTTETPYRPYPKPETPRKPAYPTKKPFNNNPWKPEKYPESKPNPDVTHTRPGELPKPDTCNTNYDAIALIRGEVFIFKSQYLWRIGETGLYDGFPVLITRMWRDLPDNFTHVDAVYQRPDEKIVIFIGRLYYMFDLVRGLLRGYPKPLTNLGLPETLEHINAAMVWGHNGKTYFFNETMYWKYDEETNHVELDYPRDMSMWKGVGNNVDAVFQWKDGKTYFFKGKGFWKFNDRAMRIEHEMPQQSAQFWMGCPGGESNEDFFRNKQPYTSFSASPTKSHYHSNANYNLPNLLLIVIVTIKLFALNT